MVTTNAPNNATPPKSLPDICVLCIEDNKMNRRLVQKMLKRTCEVVGANNGQEGLRIAQEIQPDLILLDINLPDMNGFQVFKALRTQTCFDDTPIIALTANAMYGDREHILEAGFDGYLAKPVTRVELIETVTKAFPQTA
ncbi:MAG: response regulator [Chloroflexota bacterium]